MAKYLHTYSLGKIGKHIYTLLLGFVLYIQSGKMFTHLLFRETLQQILTHLLSEILQNTYTLTLYGRNTKHVWWSIRHIVWFNGLPTITHSCVICIACIVVIPMLFWFKLWKVSSIISDRGRSPPLFFASTQTCCKMDNEWSCVCSRCGGVMSWTTPELSWTFAYVRDGWEWLKRWLHPQPNFWSQLP